MAVEDEHVIRSSAELMIERYGATAGGQVDLRIRELRERGQEEAAKLWVEIGKVVKELSSKRMNKLN